MTFRPYQREDRAWIEKANARFYRTGHNFNSTFDDALKEALDLLEHQKMAADSHYLVAVSEKRLVGCIFLSAETPRTGRIRLFYVEERYRGRGLGKLLLSDVLNAAGERHFSEVRVSTFDRHREACRLYETFGFQPVKTARAVAFGQIMTQVDYALSIDGEKRLRPAQTSK